MNEKKTALDLLAERCKGLYTAQHVKELEDAEQQLRFSQFDSATALRLGTLIVEESKLWKEGVAVTIFRESDNTVIFQYVDDDRGQRNLEFAMKKRAATRITHHCSLWGLAKGISEDSFRDLFEPDCECLPAGGAFPIIAGQSHLATIAVSGLHEGQDHVLIVRSLAVFLDIEVPEFTGKLI